MRVTLLRFALPLVVTLCAVVTGRGQNVILAEHKGKMLPVVRDDRQHGLVRVGDKLVIADGSSFLFHQVDEFLPLFVTVSGLNVSTRALQVIDTGSTINHEFYFRATFDSLYYIKDPFLALRLELADRSKFLLVYEIGDLGLHHPRSLTLTIPLSSQLDEGRYTLHIFADGVELLHSEQPFDFREHALDHIVANRIAGLPDGPPKPLFGPMPEYPLKLAKAKLQGSVLVHCTVRANGAVTDPVVKSATDPAFGEAALFALRQWRFIPRIKGGRPIDTEVNLPLNFAPPEKS